MSTDVKLHTHTQRIFQAYILRIFACIIVYFAYISRVYFGTFVKAVKFPVKSKCGKIHSKVSGTVFGPVFGHISGIRPDVLPDIRYPIGQQI